MDSLSSLTSIHSSKICNSSIIHPLPLTTSLSAARTSSRSLAESSEVPLKPLSSAQSRLIDRHERTWSIQSAVRSLRFLLDEIRLTCIESERHLATNRCPTSYPVPPVYLPEEESCRANRRGFVNRVEQDGSCFVTRVERLHTLDPSVHLK